MLGEMAMHDQVAMLTLSSDSIKATCLIFFILSLTETLPSSIWLQDVGSILFESCKFADFQAGMTTSQDNVAITWSAHLTRITPVHPGAHRRSHLHDVQHNMIHQSKLNFSAICLATALVCGQTRQDLYITINEDKTVRTLQSGQLWFVFSPAQPRLDGLQPAFDISLCFVSVFHHS